MSVNEVRNHLINYEVYEDGSRLLGTATIDLPEISYKTVTLSGAGVAGDIDFPSLGMTENMECTLHWRTINGDVTSLLDPRAHNLTLRGAMQNYDAGQGIIKVQAVKIDIRALPTSGTMGKFEQASETDTETAFSLDYFKLSIDGAELVEIDKLNYIHKIGGTDRLADVRAAVGL